MDSLSGVSSRARGHSQAGRDDFRLGSIATGSNRHWSARGLFDRNKALWASFVLETPAGKIYIVCDSGYGGGQHFRRVAEAHGPLRLAILPIGAYEPRWFMRDQHMNPADAVKALEIGRAHV